MAIADDFSIDYVNRRITYTGTFSDDIAPTRYTVNELYSYLQDTFDEPAQMDDPVPMSAQTPTQYTLINKWFMDDETVKALYSGSIQTSNWLYDGVSEGITQVLWDGGTSVPEAADIGVTVTGGSSGATGVILAVDATRLVVWIRNTNAFQFTDADTVTGTGVNFTVATDTDSQQGIRTGESVWANAFSVGTVQEEAEIYIAQESEWHGGDTTPILTKLTSWWDTNTDFTASTNGVASGHIDILIKVRDAGIWIDDLNAGSAGRLAAYARQGQTVYSHFEFLGSVGNFVIPFASTGTDINQQGFNRFVMNGAVSGPFTIGEVIYGSTAGRAILTAYESGSYMEYVLIGKNQTDFGDTDTITGVTSGETCTRTTGAATDVHGAQANGITITVGHALADIDQNGTDENYAITVDCNSNALSVVYERLMYLTSRGSTTGILGEPGVGDEDGEFYRGVGDTYFAVTGAGTGTLTVGETVSQATSLTTAEVVAHLDSDYVILTNVKGTISAGETITGATSGSTVVPAAAGESLVDVNAAPFGSFAGGRFFVARGVLLTNVPAADNNNWQTSDVAGTSVQPPTTITLTLAGLTANDRGVVLEVTTDGGTDVTKTAVGLASGAVGSSTIVLDSTVEQDVPSTGWIRVVDTSEAANGTEYRYEFSGISTTDVTLRTVTGGTGSVTAEVGPPNSGILLTSTGIGDNDFDFVAGAPKTGHHIRNTTDGSSAVILRSVSTDVIETTPLTGGTENYWKNTDAFDINKVVVLVDAADTCYFPFIDDVVPSGGAVSLSNSLKYAANTTVLARARFSDPDVGGTRILPFELLGQSITNADLTITAIRTTDPIAT